MTTITYEAVALNLAQYATNPPREGEIPVLQDKDNHEHYTSDGWVIIGRATVTVEYLDETEIRSQQLGALKQKLQSVRAENQRRENAILDQISKLSCLTHEEIV